MSAEFNAYCSQISDRIIPQLVKRLNQFEMQVEIWPNFSFTNFSGFLPFKLRLTNSPFKLLKDKDLKSGFEFFSSDFDLQTELAAEQPSTGMLGKFFGKKPTTQILFSSQIDAQLAKCKKNLIFSYSEMMDSFEFRMAALTGAIIAELTDGVFCNANEDIWYDKKNLIDKVYQDVKSHEKKLAAKNLKFHPFTKW